MKVGFIHIGMMKTATTYMQNVWLRDSAYCLAHKGTLPLVLELRELAKSGQGAKSPTKEIQVDTQYQEGQTLVVSNEGFSTAYMNDLKHQEKIPDFFELTTRSLADLSAMTQNILIVVREPRAWIRSIFVQSIKEGNSGNMECFIQNQKQFLKYSLNMRMIYSQYKRYFDNILIVPYELFKRDNDEFWSLVAERFNVPRVSAKLDLQVNESLTAEKTYLLSELNGLSRLLTQALTEATSYTNAKEKTSLVNGFTNNSKWTFRRFMEHADDDRLAELKEMLQNSSLPDGFFDYALPDDLLVDIREDYVDFLRDKIDSEFSDLYAAGIQP